MSWLCIRYDSVFANNYANTSYFGFETQKRSLLLYQMKFILINYTNWSTQGCKLPQICEQTSCCEQALHVHRQIFLACHSHSSVTDFACHSHCLCTGKYYLPVTGTHLSQILPVTAIACAQANFFCLSQPLICHRFCLSQPLPVHRQIFLPVHRHCLSQTLPVWQTESVYCLCLSAVSSCEVYRFNTKILQNSSKYTFCTQLQSFI